MFKLFSNELDVIPSPSKKLKPKKNKLKVQPKKRVKNERHKDNDKENEVINSTSEGAKNEKNDEVGIVLC